MAQENNMNTKQFLESTIKYKDWVPVRSPGLQFYADEIVAGCPFSLVRYGEGEWRSLHPDMQKKKNHIYSEWREAAAQKRLRDTLLNYHRHPRYWPAIWHQRAYATGERMGQIKRWLKENNLNDIPWHDGRLWRRAIEEDHNISIFVKGLKGASQPIIVVGPDRIKAIGKHIKLHAFIPIHPTHAYYDIDKIKTTIRNMVPEDGAVICFSAGGTACILIHDLFPELGDKCFLIDCGAFWEALVGMKTRPYHKELDERKVEKLWRK